MIALFCCPRWTRTTAGRTKICSATITPWDNCECKSSAFLYYFQIFHYLFFIFFSFCSHLFLWQIYLINIIIYYISNTYKSILSLLYCFLFSKKIFLFFSLLTFLLIPFYSFKNPYFTLLYLLFFNTPYLHFPFLLIIPKNIF